MNIQTVKLYLLLLLICCSHAEAQTFSTISVDSVKVILRQSTSHLNKILLEIGETNRTEMVDPILSFLRSNNKLSAQIRWTAHLALARLGEKSALDYILQRVQKLGVDDDVVYDLFPGLVYTRQRIAINYVIEVMKRDDKNCMSADPENPEPINCAYRALEFLAPVIEDFPIKTDASGDLDVEDYAAALAEARAWFKQHPDYKIVVDR